MSWSVVLGLESYSFDTVVIEEKCGSSFRLFEHIGGKNDTDEFTEMIVSECRHQVKTRVLMNHNIWRAAVEALANGGIRGVSGQGSEHII